MASRTTVTLVFNHLPAIARRMAPAALDVIAETLVEMDVTVQTGMGASGSPSSPGSMPGVDTGALRASMQHEIARGKYKGTYFTPMEYAPHLEYGTTRMAARPFMTPSAERARPHFMSKMKNLEPRLR